MILVTGAAGKTGREVIRALVSRNKDVRAFVRRPQQSEEMISLGAADVIAGDLGNRSDVEAAFDGVDVIYHICPNVDPNEVEYADLLISAAVEEKVKHFGYHSVLHPQTERMIHHVKKLRVEEKLFESGLAFTILQPCAYMQNLLAQHHSIVSDGVIKVPYSVETKFSLVDLADVASAIATTICEPGHIGAIYELSGPEPLNYLQIAATVGRVLSKSVRVEKADLNDWIRNAHSSGLNEYAINALSAMFEYYDEFGLQGNSNILSFLLGRDPITLSKFLEREFAE